VTREEVARECEKLGWMLLTRTLYGPFGDERVTSIIVHLERREQIGQGDSPHDAYLEACKREGKSPF